MVLVLCGEKDAKTEQIEAGSAIHGALDQFESVDIPLNWAIAPGVLESGEEGCLIVAQMFREARQWTSRGGALPFWPCRYVAFPDDAEELAGCFGQGLDFRGASVEFLQKWLRLFKRFQYLPSDFARRHMRLNWFWYLLLLAFTSAAIMLL